MDGKFLLLPLKGKGKTKMVLTGVEAHIEMKTEPVTKADGEIYWDLTNFKISITKATNFKVNFDNLFNGDKILGESTNKALNDNWEGFWGEIGPALQEVFSEIFRSTANVLISKIPVKNLFGP
ncbi:hypothetical protein L9F63_017360 [Diploptera punctata]|uniref:Protein takeout n=1 Tax=Diploptera punctata TaxID=6984 RepID=A0AAD7ZZ52_DIPPU|nr:hypothetical protein L9F63_017360 [Diploptera punctata]